MGVPLGLSKRPHKIRTQFFFLAIVVSAASLLAVGLFSWELVESQLESRLARTAMSIAHSVASIPAVQFNVGRPGGAGVIQPLADGIRKETGVEFVVVFDMQDRRYSHPLPERIGKKAVGGDHGPVLERGEAYISRAVGSLGPSMRALVPIYHEGRQVGGVSVGILIDDIDEALDDLLLRLVVALLPGLLIALVGAIFLAWNIKRSTWGLEPHEIARLLHERESMLDSIKEGIIAVDEGGSLTLVNGAAKRLLGLAEDAPGNLVEELIPNTGLPLVLKSGEAELNQEINLLGRRIMTNRLPIMHRGRVVGAIASFRDMTELRSLAEEITGVRLYLEALRVQNHEFRNKLQAISGLIQLGEPDRALNFIAETFEMRASQDTLVTRQIRNPAVGGILLGKMGRCRELGVTLRVSDDSHCLDRRGVDSRTLVVIIGNLLENAIEAVTSLPEERKEVTFSIYDESNRILISVADRGPGIPPEEASRVFEKGYSTKSGPMPRGYGLYNVWTLVEACKGEITLHSVPGGGAEWVVNLPTALSREVEIHGGH
ncbi:MAG: sensor histidine kinase [Synergistales bacterium]|nr:sensor histidine kinase [Synergistales bacterium]